MTGAICYPPDTDWGCTFTQEEIDDMLDKPEVVIMMERAESMAWTSLAALTGYQIATCPITVRPCIAACEGAGTWMTSIEGGNAAGALGTTVARFSPHVGASGLWVNSACGHSADDCSCTSLCEVILPGPVGGIEKVTVDGVILSATAYRVDNGNRLVRTDGGCWPACQDMSKPGTPEYAPVVHDYAQGTVTFTRTGDEVRVKLVPKPVGGGPSTIALPWPHAAGVLVWNYTQGTMSTSNNGTTYGFSHGPAANGGEWVYRTTAAAGPIDSSDTFLVSYYRGVAPNTMTKYAAGVLAGEFLKACLGDECRLPSGVTAVARQGVTFQVATGMFTGGLTGIREVDAVISMYNPNGLQQGPIISSPDLRKPRVTTWG